MANNPYVNKVQLADGTSLIDISSDTVTADKLMQGYTAHDRTGALITGTAQSYIDGNNLEYGFTDGSLPLVGIAKVDSAHVWDDQLQMMIFGTGQIGTGRVV